MTSRHGLGISFVTSGDGMLARNMKSNYHSGSERRRSPPSPPSLLPLSFGLFGRITQTLDSSALPAIGHRRQIHWDHSPKAHNRTTQGEPE